VRLRHERGGGDDPVMRAPSAVVFDLYGTLTDPDVEVRRPQYDAVLARVAGASPEAWTAAMRASFTERATGAWGGVEEILRRICGGLGLDPNAETLARLVELRIEHHRTLTAPRVEACDVLRRLRGRDVRIGVVSDCTPEIEFTWPTFAPATLVDAAVFSCRTGERKPAAIMYEQVVRRLDVDPRACWYVGDGSSRELTGAERFGMQAIKIDGAVGAGIDEDVDWTGPRIRRLDELLPLIESAARDDLASR
jgi:putative hydrolase of the HAD superfamily